MNAPYTVFVTAMSAVVREVCPRHEHAKRKCDCDCTCSATWRHPVHASDCRWVASA